LINDLKLNKKQVIIINCLDKDSGSNIDPFKFDEIDLEFAETPSFEEIEIESINIRTDKLKPRTKFFRINFIQS